MLNKRCVVIGAGLALLFVNPLVATCQRRAGQAQTQTKSRSSAKALQADETPLDAPGQKITVTASLRRGTFKYENVSGPSWNITIKVSNPTAQEIELGESLVVLEALRNDELFAANYIARSVGW